DVCSSDLTADAAQPHASAYAVHHHAAGRKDGTPRLPGAPVRGRATHIKLTEWGEDIQDDLAQARESMEDDLISVLGDRYPQVLTEMMQKASQQMEEGQ